MSARSDQAAVVLHAPLQGMATQRHVAVTVTPSESEAESEADTETEPDTEFRMI